MGALGFLHHSLVFSWDHRKVRYWKHCRLEQSTASVSTGEKPDCAMNTVLGRIMKRKHFGTAGICSNSCNVNHTQARGIIVARGNLTPGARLKTYEDCFNSDRAEIYEQVIELVIRNRMDLLVKRRPLRHVSMFVGRALSKFNKAALRVSYARAFSETYYHSLMRCRRLR